jgi:hypothetical protein
MNRKATPYYLNGEKFVILSEIPSAQVNRFTHWTLSHTGPDAKKASGLEMAKYDDYEFWFEQHYLAEQDIDQLI